VRSLRLLHSQPRAWLRLGEACIASYVEAQRQRLRETGAELGIVGATPSRSHAGEGSRYLVLPTGGPVGAGLSEPPADDLPAESSATTGSPEPPAPTLAYGIKCMRNALLLCGHQLGGAQLSSVSAAEYAALNS